MILGLFQEAGPGQVDFRFFVVIGNGCFWVVGV